jgi:hypothetical protein
MDNIDRIIKDEYAKIKKGTGKPFHIIAQSLDIPLLDLYKRIRSFDNAFALQIEEINFILENRNTIPRFKLKEMFNLTDSLLSSLRNRGIKLSDDRGIDYVIKTTKWLIEKELKLNLDGQLPHKLNDNILRKYKLGRSKHISYKIQEDNPEFYAFPAIFIMVDSAYPNIYKPWQFRHLKSQYWKDKELGKIRLADALRWLVEEKKGISKENIPHLKNLKGFITSRELDYYHLRDASQFQFKSQREWIDYTYPENRDKVNREHTKTLRDKLQNANRIFNECEICGFKDKTEIHHIVPIDTGGSNDVTNLICLCSNHHAQAAKGNFHYQILYSHIKKVDRVNHFIQLFRKEIV